jgi:glycosyltransferase involved in cell wall biosynthesis
LRTSSPLVSVVMSVFNGERYLRAALESVLAQEGVDFEVVVVDDGSTDGSADLLAEFARRDDRVRVIRQENAGLTRALMRGCAKARGEFIVRQDDDDLSVPGRFEKQAALLRSRAGIMAVASWVRLIGPEGEHLDDVRFPEGEEAGTEAVMHGRKNPIHGSVMFRKSAYEMAGGYRPEFYFAQDSDLWLRLGALGPFFFIPEILYHFRFTETSVTSRYRAAQLRLYEIAKSCQQRRATGEGVEDLLAEAQKLRPGGVIPAKGRPWEGAYFLGRMLLRKGNPAARKYLWSFCRQRPFDPRGWVSLGRTTWAKGDECRGT